MLERVFMKLVWCMFAGGRWERWEGVFLGICQMYEVLPLGMRIV